MLRFCDGFDSYTSIADLRQKWGVMVEPVHGFEFVERETSNWQWVSNEGVNTGGCIKHTGDAGEPLSRPIYRDQPNHNQKKYSRNLLWFKIATPPAARVPFIRLLGNGRSYLYPNYRFDLDIDTNGFLIQKELVKPTEASPVDIYTGNLNVCDNAWHCIERYVFFDYDSTTPIGILRIELDGVELVNNSAVNTKKSFYYEPDTLVLISLGVDMWIDDVIIWDDAGDNPVEYGTGHFIDPLADEFAGDYEISTTLANIISDTHMFEERGQDGFYGWMGPKQITTLRPTGPGAVNNFDVVGAASSWEAVNDVALDDADYIETATIGNREVFAFEDFPHAGLAIAAVAMNYQLLTSEHYATVIQPEALQSPDFELGWRRKVYGKFVFVGDGVELVANGGPNFVDTTGWVYSDAANAVLDVSNGNLRINKHTTGTPTPYALYTLTGLIPNAVYILDCKSDELSTQPFFCYPVGNLKADTSSIQIGTRRVTYFIPTSDTHEIWFRYGASSSTIGEIHLEYLTIQLAPPAHLHRLYQWAMIQDPTTLAAWTKAGVDSAQFGLRISQ